MRYILVILLVACLLVLTGCTINFKAKEIELDSQPPITYELESIDIFKIDEPEPVVITPSAKTFAKRKRG